MPSRDPKRHSSIRFNFIKALLAASILFVAGACVFLIPVFYYSDEDEKAYRQLVQQSNPINSNQSAAPYKATQHRERIQKDLLYSQGRERLQVRLNSQKADLIIHHKEDSNELIENMQGVTGCIQEELFYLLSDGSKAVKNSNGQFWIPSNDKNPSSSWVDPTDPELIPMQHIRYLEAATATYEYKTGQLIANQVKISRYTIPGHTIPPFLKVSLTHYQPQMSGVAQGIEFSLNGSRKMTLRGEVALEHEMGRICADEVVITSSDPEKKNYFDHFDIRRIPCDSVDSEEGNGICQVTSWNGDVILSDQMKIDGVNERIYFYKPKGVLQTAAHFEGGKINFSSESMICDCKMGKMIFRKKVQIDQKGLGNLTTDNEVIFLQTQRDGKKRLSTMESSGKTVLFRPNENKELQSQVICYGRMIVDHLNLLITMESPKDDQGIVKNEEQVFYQNSLGETYADQASIQYDWKGGAISPSYLTLTGHVRFLDASTAENGIHSPLSKYAIADKMEYNPFKKEAILSADKNSRVLCYSKANGLQVSAPSLKIRRDEITKKEWIKGMGDVRFNFIEHEFEQLKQRFSLNQTSTKERQGL